MRKHEDLCVRSETSGLTSIVGSRIAAEVEFRRKSRLILIIPILAPSGEFQISLLRY